MTELEKARQETVKFMRGRYRPDEVAAKIYSHDCLRVRQGGTGKIRSLKA